MNTVKQSIGDRQFCTFRLAGLLFGVDVLNVQEVLQGQEITEVPHSRRSVSGLLNLRGQIAATIDMRSRLGLPPRDDAKMPVHIVVKFHDEPVSLVVDEIGDVMSIDPDLYEPPPETVSGSAKELISGAYKLDGQLLMALDIGRTLSLEGTS